MQKITPMLWFDDQAAQAAEYYVAVFNGRPGRPGGSRIVETSHYGEAGPGKPGSVMVVGFELDGQPFTALNGGPLFQFNEAVSFQINCETQDEADHYWEKLTAGGDEKAQQCGWLKDKFGLSWQVVPEALADMVADQNSEGGKRAMAAMLHMKKIDIATLEEAYEGEKAHRG